MKNGTKELVNPMKNYHKRYDLPFDFNFRMKRRKPIAHRVTCPVCGKKLVNIYLRNGEWKCKQCWEVGESNG